MRGTPTKLEPKTVAEDLDQYGENGSPTVLEKKEGVSVMPTNHGSPYLAVALHLSPERAYICSSSLTWMLRLGIGIIQAVYGGCIAVVFGMLASERSDELSWKLIFAISAALANYPMAVEFSTKFFLHLKSLWKKLPGIMHPNQNKDLLFCLSTVIALGLAALTTLSGVALSRRSVGGLLKNEGSTVDDFATMFAAYTFSTRIMGAHNLIYADLFNFVQYLKRRYFSQGKLTPYLMLLDDLKKQSGKITPSREQQDVENTAFIQAFYNELSNQHIQPDRFGYIDVVKMMLASSFVLLSLTLIPIWLKLTDEGLRALNWKWTISLANNSTFVWFAALSNQLFYLNIMFRILGTALSAFNKMKEEHIKMLCIACTLVSLGTIAWFSGTGMAAVSKKMRDASFITSNNSTHDPIFTGAGYGSVAMNTFFAAPFLLALFSKSAPYLPKITDFVVALVNGRSILNFLMSTLETQSNESKNLLASFFYTMFSYTSPTGKENQEKKKQAPFPKLIASVEQAIHRGTFDDVAIPLGHLPATPLSSDLQQPTEGIQNWRDAWTNSQPDHRRCCFFMWPFRGEHEPLTRNRTLSQVSMPPIENENNLSRFESR